MIIIIDVQSLMDFQNIQELKNWSKSHLNNVYE